MYNLADNQYLWNLTYEPSKKALEFYEASNHARQLLWLGGVRSLKTSSVEALISYHLHGIYPSWFNGYRYDRPVHVMAGTVKASKVRDVLQMYLFKGDHLCGLKPFIHPSLIVKSFPMRGTTGGFEKVLIRHASGGVSEIKFVSFAEGASNMQSERFDIVHLDECPSFPIYNEVVCRTAAMGDYKTFVFLTMWPENGRDELVDMFMNNGSAGEVVKGNFYMHSSWSDNPHLSEEEKQRLRDASPKYLLEAREHGIPIFGVGKVFTMPESEIVIPPFEIPPQFKLIVGVDPAATSNGFWGAILLALDRDNDILYVVKDYKKNGITRVEHHDNMLYLFPKWIPRVCDPAGGGEDQLTRETSLDYLINQGLNVTKAYKVKGAKESVITDIEIRCRSGKFKIFNTCVNYLDEWRRYSRDEKGIIIKENDHTIDASFYALSSLKYSRSETSYDIQENNNYGGYI